MHPQIKEKKKDKSPGISNSCELRLDETTVTSGRQSSGRKGSNVSKSVIDRERIRNLLSFVKIMLLKSYLHIISVVAGH